MTTLCAAAAALSASVVGPGIGSERSKLPASSMRARALSRLRRGSASQLIWTSAIRSGSGFMIYLDSNRRRMPPAASVKHWCRRRDRGAGQPGSELFESKPLSQNRGLVVQFYLTDAFLLDTVVRFIE